MIEITKVGFGLLLTEGRDARFTLTIEEFFGELHSVFDELAFRELFSSGVFFELNSPAKLVVRFQKLLPGLLEFDDRL